MGVREGRKDLAWPPHHLIPSVHPSVRPYPVISQFAEYGIKTMPLNALLFGGFGHSHFYREMRIDFLPTNTGFITYWMI